MTGLASLLPKPKDEGQSKSKSEETDISQETRIIQPETQKSEMTVGVLPKEYDAAGRLKSEEILARVGHSDSRVLQCKLEDMLPCREERQWVKPGTEEIARQTEATKAALEKILDGKIKSVVSSTGGKSPATSGKGEFVRFTGKDDKQRIIRVVEAPKDPFEPPKFHHKRIPRPPPSPPAPVLHSPPRKVTKEEQEAWRIPPCISNWKNAKGYTIPLDKRLAADGRGLIDHSISSNFAPFAESLYLAEQAAKEEVERRAAVAQKLAEQERKQTEERLRALAEQARREKSSLAADLRYAQETDASVAEREAWRKDKMREHERDARLSRMGPEQRTKLLARDTDRDVSERIALGQAVSAGGRPAETSMFDQRLFDQTQGIASGLGDDETYSLYSKPLFAPGHAAAHLMYRPGATAPGNDDEDEGEAATVGPKRKGFEGSERVAPRTGPVEFERVADPFGLDQLLQEAKRQKQ